MFIRKKKRKTGKTSVQICESYRRGDKVNQRIVRHVGQGVGEKEIEVLVNLANTIIAEIKEERKPSLPLFKPEELLDRENRKSEIEDDVLLKNLKEEQRIIDGIGDVFGKLYSDLGFESVIDGTRKDTEWNSILKACTLSRLANPSSKRRTASLLERDFAIRIPLEKIYRMMDHLAVQEDKVKNRIESATLSLFKEKVDILLFDVTTLYFESFEPDELRKPGFSKDNKVNETQIMLALVTTNCGMPVTYKIFLGNTYEGNTLLDMVDELKKGYDVENISIVADRAMFTEKNLQKMEAHGINYIVAAKLKTMSKAMKNQILDSSLEQKNIDGESNWTGEFDYKARRLIVNYSTDRARKDAKDRERLVKRLQKKIKGKKINVNDLISNSGSKRFVTVEKGSKAFLNEAKIADSARWDGLHGIITNNRAEDAAKILSRYQSLWQIEAAFRISKHDLRMRPIYHWSENRIKAHISICFMAYALAKQTLYRLTVQKKMPMSFERLRNELLHVQSS
ncbi:MAG: IS1634 family transposase, partial [Candidatus Zixiibacteriota bacterium]